MQTRQIELSDVFYNAANQSFEGLVTVHDGPRARRYACAINAPIDMTYEAAAKGLSTQALRRHNGRGGLFSELTTAAPTIQRAGRRNFDPVRWLQSIANLPLPGHRAA